MRHLLTLLVLSVGLFAQGPTPDQLRLSLPQDTQLRLVGMMKRPDGTTKFVTVKPSQGLASATAILGKAYDGDIRLDFAYVAYRAQAPIGPGPCTWDGTGAIAATPTALYVCTPDANGTTFSWTRFTGGSKVW